MKKKRTLVYSNPINYFDTDCTVIHHLVKEYNVVWYPIIYASYTKKYAVEDLEQYAKANGIEFRLVFINNRMRSLNNFVYYYSLLKNIKHQKADVIFTSTEAIHWHFFALFFLNRKKLVQGIHDVEIHSGARFRYLFSLINRFIMKVYINYITYSKSQQSLLKQKYNKDSFCVGMSSKAFGKSFLLPIAIENKLKILFFGGISWYKGLDILINTLEKIHSEGIDRVQLSICGNGKYWEECRKLLKTPKMYNLQIRIIDNSEIADLFSSHHFLILPYRDVTNSGPMMIAVNYQLPIIAPNMGCFRDVYANNMGVLYEQGHLYETLKKVISMDGKTYKALKNACVELCKRYDEQSIAKRYIDVFNSL